MSKDGKRRSLVMLDSAESATGFLRERYESRYGQLAAAAQMGLELSELFKMLGDPDLQRVLERFRGPYAANRWKEEGFESGNWSGAMVLFGRASLTRSTPTEVPALGALTGKVAPLVEHFEHLAGLKASVDELVRPLSAAERRDVFKKLASPLNMACACVLLTAEHMGLEKYPSPLELAAIFVVIGDKRLGDFVADRDELFGVEEARDTMKTKVLREVLELLRTLAEAPPSPFPTHKKERSERG